MLDHNNRPLDDSLIAARAEIRRFYDDLERLLKKHQPIEYALFAARRLKKAWGNDKMMGQSPPHYLLHSIEANCAYARGHHNEPVGWNEFAKVMNVYHKYPDPLQLKTASENLIMFGLVMYRSQMEIQYSPSREAVARARRLFVVGNPMPRLSQEFSRRYQLSLEDWLRLAFITYVTARSNESGCFKQEQVRNYEHLKIAGPAVDRFFAMSSATPKEVAGRYRSVRRDVPIQFHSLIRSVFLERPLIDFGQGRMLAPHAELIQRNSSDGLYRLIRDLPHFDAEFGGSVERYVGHVLDACQDKIRMLDKSQLESVSKGKSCDFLLETPSPTLPSSRLSR